MQSTTFIEILEAAHLSVFVQSVFPERGGIMIVGPPGVLKTTMIEDAYSIYPNALIVSDLNINSLMSLRQDLVSGRFSTIALSEFEKLYQRRQDTASNIEGSLKALVQEGFSRTSHEDQGMMAVKSRAFVVGAMTYNFYSRHYQGWKNSGFLRRFLWCSVSLKQPNQIMDAIHQWEKIQLAHIHHAARATTIPYSVTEYESLELQKILVEQWEATPYVLIKKIFSVLKWKHASARKAMHLMTEFGECLSRERPGLIDLTITNGKEKHGREKSKRAHSRDSGKHGENERTIPRRARDRKNPKARSGSLRSKSIKRG